MLIPTRYRSRLASDWTILNPVLEEGSIGYEEDTNQFKIGNGDLHWVDLLYFTNANILTAPGWDDLRLSLLASTKGVVGPDLEVFRGSTKCYAFDKNTDQSVHFDVQLPHNWILGSTVEPHVHWSPGNSTNTGAVRWQLSYTWANNAEAFANPTIMDAVDKVSPGVAYTHLISDLGTIVGTDKRKSSILMCTLTRVATATEDTFDGDAYGLSVDFHIQVSGNGSDSEYGGT